MVTLATADASLYLPLADLVDVEQELARIAKEKEKAEEGLRRIEAKLSNENFVSKAPANVVEGQRQQAEKIPCADCQAGRKRRANAFLTAKKAAAARCFDKLRSQ